MVASIRRARSYASPSVHPKIGRVDRLKVSLGDDDAADIQEFFHVTMAQRATEIQIDSVADDLPQKPMMCVRIGRA